MTMQSTTLRKEEWQSTLERISQACSGSAISIEVSSAAIGAQTEAENVPMRGISYDPRSDAVWIDIEGLNHIVAKPKQITLAYQGTDLISAEIIDADDARHRVSFSFPLSVPLLERM